MVGRSYVSKILGAIVSSTNRWICLDGIASKSVFFLLFREFFLVVKQKNFTKIFLSASLFANLALAENQPYIDSIKIQLEKKNQNLQVKISEKTTIIFYIS